MDTRRGMDERTVGTTMGKRAQKSVQSRKTFTGHFWAFGVAKGRSRSLLSVHMAKNHVLGKQCVFNEPKGLTGINIICIYLFVGSFYLFCLMKIVSFFVKRTREYMPTWHIHRAGVPYGLMPSHTFIEGVQYLCVHNAEMRKVSASTCILT